MMKQLEFDFDAVPQPAPTPFTWRPEMRWEGNRIDRMRAWHSTIEEAVPFDLDGELDESVRYVVSTEEFHPHEGRYLYKAVVDPILSPSDFFDVAILQKVIRSCVFQESLRRGFPRPYEIVLMNDGMSRYALRIAVYWNLPSI